MLRMSWLVLLMFVGTGLWVPCAAQRPEDLTTDRDLIGFLDQLAEATYQFNIGNVEPYLALLSPSEELTLMGG